MAGRKGLSRAQLAADPAGNLDSATAQYVDVRGGLTLNDSSHYGDSWSSMPRALSTATRSLATGTIVYSGAIAADTFTATKLRLFPFGAAVGTGTLQAKVFTGTVQTALTPVASITNLTAVPAQTLQEVNLSASVSITPGLLVYVALLTTGWTTAPTLQCMNGSGGPVGFISPSGRVWCGVSASGQTSIPATAISAASLTASGNPLWSALL